MTKINKLVLRGFKSFAKRTELVFDNKFNCVLGPNGSGKSNILDSLTFVLGRRSSKAMRAEKSANLIYNGGKKKNPSKDAEVSIYFDNTKKVFPLDDDEVSVSRIVKKKGNSVYKINGKTHNRNAVIDLLSRASIDPDGYNVILQGDIVKFVEMATNERREIIEDIAGIGEYEEKKQKAIRELDRVEERIGEANIILTERKTHLTELKKDRDQALEFKSILEDIQKYKATYLSLSIDKKKKDIEKEESKKEEYNSKIGRANLEIDKLRNVIKEKKNAIHKLNQEVERKGEKDQVKLNRELEQLKVDIATNKTKLENYENEILRIKDRRKELEHDNKAINNKIDALERELKELTKTKLQREKELSQIEKDIDVFKKKNKFGDDVIALEKEMTVLEKESEDKEEEIQKLRQDYQNTLREKDQIEFKVDALDEQMSRVSTLEKEQQSQLSDLKSKRKFLSTIDVDLRKLISEDSEIAGEISESRSSLSVVQQKLAGLEAQHMKVVAQSAGDRAILSVMNLKKETPGIFGTISELGSVKSKFATALERAAGGRINCIVVKDDGVAAKCISYLKKNKLGSATFLPLNKMRPLVVANSVRQLTSKPGVHGLAIDLVDFNKDYEKAFNFVFGGTLIVENISTARNLGVGVARMVTLDGDSVETSGAMQGGFFQKRRAGGFAQKELTSSISELQERVASLEGKMSLFQSKRLKLDAQITKTREEKAALEGEIIKLEKSLHLDSDGLGDFQNKKKNLRDLSEEVEEKVSDLMSTISSHNQDLAKIKIRRQELRNKINEMRNPRVLAQLSAFEEKRTEIKGGLIKVETEIKSLNGNIDTILGPDVKRSRDIIVQNKKEEEKFVKIVAQMKDSINVQQQDLKEKEVVASKFMKQFKELFVKRDKLEQEVENFDKKIDGHEITVQGAEQKLNAINLDLGRFRAERVGLEKEFEPFSSVDIFKSKTDVKDMQKTVVRLEMRKENLGSVNLRALEVYENVEKEYNHLLGKKDTLRIEKDDVLKLIEEIEISKKSIFMKNFEVVNDIFQDFFQKLTTKGKAYLELEDSNNPFNGGIEIKVKLSSKKFMDIKSLSGGEKTLTALAFIFSIQEYNPASFYILDEVDAALDKHNSEKLAHLIKNYAKTAQYLVISHNDAIISEASTLYGISMNEHGISNVTTLKL
jgi:chromosome segregation protein